ncbi:MAG: hypothetical protein HQL32_03510 [Planctomycetes bacterium]|nr:hypothetical protein [Planctomycetota bacterium]
MSQKQLDTLLEELDSSISPEDQIVFRCKKINRERRSLIEAAEGPLRKKKAYLKAKEQLNKHLQLASYDQFMKDLDYPARILGGAINLESNEQQGAISELSVTLANNKDIPGHIHQLNSALKLFYSEFFTNSAQAPQEDLKAAQALVDFNEDEEKGADSHFKEYLSYLELLDKLDEKSQDDISLNADKPSFYLKMNAEKLLKTKNRTLQKALLTQSKWNRSYSKLLETFFARLDQEELQGICLTILEDDCGGVSPQFLEDMLSQNIAYELIVSFLNNKDQGWQREQLIQAVNLNQIHLMSLLINLVGFDQKFFYSSLGEHQIQPDIFKKMIETLFFSSSAHGKYGIDTAYAERVIDQQKTFPKNVIKILQDAFPRGLEGSMIDGYFSILTLMNQEMASLYKKKEAFADLEQQNKEYCELSLMISDTEAIRFLLFTYIFDSLKLGVKPKKLGLNISELQDLMAEQYEFEESTGKNKTIMKFISELWQIYPSLKPI